jgi:tetratricopeptide (TPR) repeat protein
MTMDPSITSTPFANVRDVSYFQGEDEILFSMHSIFRIKHIKQMDSSNNRLWQVDLALTSDNDPELFALTEYIRKETFPSKQGWYRLSNILVTLGQFDKAEALCDVLLARTSDDRQKGSIYHTLGMVKYNQQKLADAIQFFEKSIEFMQKFPSPTQGELLVSYNNIGVVYQ